MRQKSDEQIEAEKMAAHGSREEAHGDESTAPRRSIETVDDNPRFDSAMRMATPAPPAHFLRVFGQPARDGLGEFRDDAASLRQQLMMLNGRMTHEASRVGPKEPLHRILEKNSRPRHRLGLPGDPHPPPDAARKRPRPATILDLRQDPATAWPTSAGPSSTATNSATFPDLRTEGLRPFRNPNAHDHHRP